MKTSLLAAIAFIPCLALADTTTVPPDVTQELSVMTSRLTLSASQQDKIRPILIAEWNQKKAIQDGTLSDKKKHDQIGAIHRAALQKIKAVFTPEQIALIEKEQDQHSASSTSAGS